MFQLDLLKHHKLLLCRYQRHIDTKICLWSPLGRFVKAFTSPSDKSLPQSTFIKTIAAGQQQQPVANIEDVLEPEDLSLEPEELKSVPKPRSVQDEVERELRIEGGRAWEYYGAAQTRILNQIAKAKDQRRHELLVLASRKQKLSEWSKRLEQMQYDLTARESRILESESFLPLARQLQEMKLTLEDALPWTETIREKAAQMQNMDTKAAATCVAQELRLNRQFGDIQRQIEIAQGQLKMLNISIMQKQSVIDTLLKLKQNGVKDDDIIGLSKIIDLSRMGREWTPGQISNGNLSQSDQIRLNLLGNATTNMLNRIRPPAAGYKGPHIL